MKVAIGSDHAGFELKEKIKVRLTELEIEVIDEGCYSVERADYPDFGHAVSKAVSGNKEILGVLICGSGNGINMTANKHQEIRSALCWTPELAALARQHNDANVLALPARFIEENLAIAIVEEFLKHTFEGGRHANRVNKISC